MVARWGEEGAEEVAVGGVDFDQVFTLSVLHLYTYGGRNEDRAYRSQP